MARCSHKPVISVAASFPVDHSKVEWGLTPNGSFISYGNDESTAATNRVGKGRWIRKHCAATASLLHHDLILRIFAFPRVAASHLYKMNELNESELIQSSTNTGIVFLSDRNYFHRISRYSRHVHSKSLDSCFPPCSCKIIVSTIIETVISRSPSPRTLNILRPINLTVGVSKMPIECGPLSACSTIDTKCRVQNWKLKRVNNIPAIWIDCRNGNNETCITNTAGGRKFGVSRLRMGFRALPLENLTQHAPTLYNRLKKYCHCRFNWSNKLNNSNGQVVLLSKSL